MNGHRPRKRFGQHFLTDPGVIDAILAAIGPATQDRIVEIGPGPGAITVPLARRCRELHAIELDRDLAGRLRERFLQDAQVHIHGADALTFDFSSLGPGLRLVGNLPYNISTPLLFHLIDYRECIEDMHFMLQKEVVDRMAAAPGNRTYGRLTVMLACRFDIEALFEVDRLSFDPPPDVTSAVVRLRPLPAGTFDIRDEQCFARVVAAGFAQRRKTLRNSLQRLANVEDLLASGIEPGLRAEAIAVGEWVALANCLATKTDIPV
jgi:16S rRNA (adenine1518-N6/adenine1519-N6)-dimethyltransferase